MSWGSCGAQPVVAGVAGDPATRRFGCGSPRPSSLGLGGGVYSIMGAVGEQLIVVGAMGEEEIFDVGEGGADEGVNAG